MAVRIRATGEILCAAMHSAAPGDIYLDDSTHYVLPVDLRVLRPLRLREPTSGDSAARECR